MGGGLLPQVVGATLGLALRHPGPMKAMCGPWGEGGRGGGVRSPEQMCSSSGVVSTFLTQTVRGGEAVSPPLSSAGTSIDVVTPPQGSSEPCSGGGGLLEIQPGNVT